MNRSILIDSKYCEVGEPLKAPLILEIKRNSLDDGPGIRSVVFFKGCPLSCSWCHNPEGKRPELEIGFDAAECIGCNTCQESCQENALSKDNPFYIDRSRCNLCFDCVETCPSGALSRVGSPMTVDKILEEILKDQVFFKNSGGGVTLSGGEPTLFTDYTSKLVQALKKAGIHTLVETCGLFDLDVFEEKLYPFIDMIYYDIKLMDNGAHGTYCGAPNDRILANFPYLQDKYRNGRAEIIPRTPLIPGITDTQDNLSKIAGFLKDCGVRKAQLLAYHPLWRAKNHKIGCQDSLEDSPKLAQFLSPQKLDACRGIFEVQGIRIEK